MHKRHTLHGPAHRIGARGRSLSSLPPGESGTRIRGAQQQTPATVDENVLASIDSAMHELDSLEMPFRASAPPLSAPPPPQQMPRGMPPLPFRAPHPGNMPPLPVQQAALASQPANDAILESERAVVEAPPSRWWLFVALTMGVACLALALWLQLR